MRILEVSKVCMPQVIKVACTVLAAFALAMEVLEGVHRPAEGQNVSPVNGGTSLADTGEVCGDTNPVSLSNISWVEPRGLNIVDLVGFVPDQDLAGAIISYSPGYGIIRYQSGVRVGNTVTITAKVYPRYIKDTATGWSGSLFSCLGQPPRFDQWGAVTPAARMMLYNGAQNVTQEVGGYQYVPAAFSLPVGNTNSGRVKIYV